MRRLIAKRPDCKAALLRNINLIQKRRQCRKEQPSGYAHPGFQLPNAHALADNDESYGPIGLFLQTLEEHDCQIDDELIVQHLCEPGFSILHTPWQHFKYISQDILNKSRARKVTQKRTFCGHLDSIDTDLIKDVLAHLGHREQSVYKYICTGAWWSEQHIADDLLPPDQKVQCACPRM